VGFHSNSNKPRVLVTGARGFTGKYLLNELTKADYEVTGLIADCIPNEHEIQADLLSIEDLRRAVRLAQPDYIIHLAAISFVQHADAQAFYATNVIGTLNLLQAVADENLQPKKIIIASSANIYGNCLEDPIKESVPPAPTNHYAASKVAMEYLVRNWFDRFPIVITRPFNYTGVGQASYFLLPKIVQHFSEQKTSIELGNTDVVRDFSDVRFVAAVYRQLLEKPIVSATINICSGIGYSLAEILDYMAEIAGYKINVQVNPDFIRAQEVKRLVGDPSQLQQLIGHISPINLPETLQWMYQAASTISR